MNSFAIVGRKEFLYGCPPQWAIDYEIKRPKRPNQENEYYSPRSLMCTYGEEAIKSIKLYDNMNGINLIPGEIYDADEDFENFTVILRGYPLEFSMIMKKKSLEEYHHLITIFKLKKRLKKHENESKQLRALTIRQTTKINALYSILYERKIQLHGLDNFTNQACYLNSVLQLLIHNPVFLEITKSLNKKDPMSNRILELVDKFYSCNNDVYVADEIMKILDQFETRDENDNLIHHDAEEALSAILNALHNGCNFPESGGESGNISLETSKEAWNAAKNNDNSVFVDNYWGQVKNEMHCCLCVKTLSPKFDNFVVLTVPVPRNEKHITLDMCINKRIETEHFHVFEKKKIGWNGCDCEDVPTTAEKHTQFTKLPKVLLICLGRFIIDSNGNTKKMNDTIDFPLHGLDLNRLIPGSKKHIYDLIGVVRHQGTESFGHYITQILNDDKWIQFDDDIITRIKTVDCRPVGYSKRISQKGFHPYVLQYKRRETVKRKEKNRVTRSMSMFDQNDQLQIRRSPTGKRGLSVQNVKLTITNKKKKTIQTPGIREVH